MILRTTCALLMLWSFVAFGQTVTEAEYFFNTDPGQGNGTDIPITSGEFIELTNLNLPTSALGTGISHELYIRYRSDDGLWSLSESRNFFLHQPPADIFANRFITHAEYWFDEQAPTLVDITNNPHVVYAALIPTSGLSLNTSHKFSVRYRSSNGYISNAESRYFFLHASPGINWNAREITHAEYHFDTLAPVQVSLAINSHVSFLDTISVAGLETNKAHKLSVRYLDETGKWSNYEARYVFVHESPGINWNFRQITHAEYHFDTLAPVQVSLAINSEVSFLDTISVAGLQTNAAHKLSVRYLDETGKWSNYEARYVFVHESPAGTVTMLDVVALEYWIDFGVPIAVDIADAASISFADAVAHNVGAGQHNFHLRYVSEDGQRGNVEQLPFFVWTGAGPSNPAHLAGAEYFLNVDPGVGNGVPVTFPQDGAWDERDENAFAVLTGLPVGLHRFGIRFRDEVGNWSHTLADTFVVGPVLVISVSGSNIVLNWNANPDNIPFHIYRAPGIGGAYTEIGTSNTLTYTDTGIINLQDRQNYYITTTNNGVLSRYRLPAALRAEK